MTERPAASGAQRIGALWRRLHGLPGGRWVFSRVFGFLVPYSGSIGANIDALEPGYCRARLRERRAVRQHLKSVHAAALVNLGEMTSGLAMGMALPAGVRGIVTNLEAEYLKKARGMLTAEARVSVPDVGDTPLEHRVSTVITDAAGDAVTRVHAIWRLARR